MPRSTESTVRPRRVSAGGRSRHEWAEAEFRAVFEHAAIGIAVVDMGGRPIRVNPALVEILGYAAEEMQAMTIEEFTHPDDIAADLQLFDELLSGKRESYRMEKRYVRKDGAIIWGHLSASIVKDRSGKPAYAIGMLKDITERKRAEERATQTLELVRRLSDERRDLVAQVVAVQDQERRQLADDLHDDPIQKLTAATVRLGQLRRAVADADARRIVDDIESTTSQAIARLRALQFDLWPRSLDHPGGLREALRMRLEDLEERAGIGTRMVDEVTEPVSTEIRTTAYRVLVEALANVQKHSEARQVTVTLRTAEDGLLIAVADDGRGFDARSAASARHAGLASMRERAEAVGGAWSITSSPGDGTLVRFWLPAKVA